MRPFSGQEHDRLQEAGLARCVGADDELRAGSEVHLERWIAPEVEEVKSREQPRFPDERFPVEESCVRRQEVVRTGITTWT